ERARPRDQRAGRVSGPPRRTAGPREWRALLGVPRGLRSGAPRLPRPRPLPHDRRVRRDRAGAGVVGAQRGSPGATHRRRKGGPTSREPILDLGRATAPALGASDGRAAFAPREKGGLRRYGVLVLGAARDATTSVAATSPGGRRVRRARRSPLAPGLEAVQLHPVS